MSDSIDTLLQDVLCECYAVKSVSDGIERAGYIVPSMVPGFAWLQIWVATGAAVLDSVRTERPVPALQAAQVVREHFPDLGVAEIVRWAHPGCLLDPFADERASTSYWANGQGAH